MAEALLKALLFLGLILFLGAGIFARWVGPEWLVGSSRASSRLRLGWRLGAALTGLASVLILIDTVTRALGGFYPVLMAEFAFSSHFGRVSMLRGVFVLALLGLGLEGRLPGRLDRVSFVVIALGLVVTVSQLSHAGAIGEALPLAADALHLIAATLWVGPLIFLAWLPVWQEQRGTEADLLAAVKRVSWLGLASVLLLTGTGVYASLLHLFGLDDLATSYGRALIVKLSLIAAILSIAAVNRWWLMPKVERYEAIPTLKQFVRLASLLLVAVLVATGALTTREPPADQHHLGAQPRNHLTAFPRPMTE